MPMLTPDHELHTQIQYRLMEELSQAERRYHNLLENLYEIVFEMDMQGRLTFLNSAWTNHLGYAIADSLGRLLAEMVHVDDRQLLSGFCQSIKPVDGNTDIKTIKRQELRIYHHNQQIVWFELSGQFDPQRGLSGSLVNITERRQAQEALEQQVKEEQFLSIIAQRIRQSLHLADIFSTTVVEVRRMLQSDRALIYRFNPDWTGVVVCESVGDGWISLQDLIINDACFGVKACYEAYTQGRFQAIADVTSNGIAECYAGLLTRLQVRANLVIPIVNNEQLNTEHLWGLLVVQQCSRPRAWEEWEIDLLQKVSLQVGIAIHQSQLYEQLQAELYQREQAFAELKQTEEKLQSSLQEKEILLKEIHHRVKNNLLVVASLLDLQAEHLQDDAIAKTFEDSQHRIYSMALIHEKLYQSKQLDKVDLSEYLETLAQQLVISLEDHRPIRLIFDLLQSVFVNVETAVPCGLIVNELICNSFEHAFPHASEGIICLSVVQSPEGEVTIVIADNGVGLPQHIDFRNTESLGLQLVCLLTKQLGGEIQLNPEQEITPVFSQNMDRNASSSLNSRESLSHGTAFQLRFSELHYQRRY